MGFNISMKGSFWGTCGPPLCASSVELRKSFVQVSPHPRNPAVVGSGWTLDMGLL